MWPRAPVVSLENVRHHQGLARVFLPRALARVARICQQLRTQPRGRLLAVFLVARVTVACDAARRVLHCLLNPGTGQDGFFPKVGTSGGRARAVASHRIALTGPV